MTSQKETLKTLLYICKLRYRKYPAYYFPIYLILKYLQEFDFKFTTRKIHFQLRAIPNKYFDFLCREHEIQSDHTIFINSKVFDYYIYQKDVNFINVMLSDTTKKIDKLSHAEKVVKQIMNSPQNKNKDNKTQTIFQVFPLHGVPINKVFIKENSFWNFVDKFKISHENEIFVNLSMLGQNQKIPIIATKCNIFLINPPYDVPNAFIDDVLKEYFRKPRLLYRNHTYRIELTETELGNFIFCEHFLLIAKLKRLFIKCVHLENRFNPFETSGIVMYNLTELHQSTTISYPAIKQLMSDHFVTNYPAGLESLFISLQSAIKPFLDGESKDLLRSRKIFPIFQLLGERGSGKRKILQAVADSLGFHIHFAECCEIISSLSSQTEQKLLYTLHRATNCQPIILCFNDFEFFGRNNEGHEDERVINFFKSEIDKLFTKNCFDNPIIIVAMVNSSQPLKCQKLGELFLETIEFKPLEKDERLKCLLWSHQSEKFDRLCYAIKRNKIQNYINIYSQNVSKNDLEVLRKMSEQTQGFSLSDLRILYRRSICEPNDDPQNFHLEIEDFNRELTLIKKCFSDSIGTPEIPRVLWEDIGGLANLKKEIQNSIGLPLKYSHILAGKNLKRSGILLFGPPGEELLLISIFC